MSDYLVTGMKSAGEKPVYIESKGRIGERPSINHLDDLRVGLYGLHSRSTSEGGAENYE